MGFDERACLELFETLLKVDSTTGQYEEIQKTVTQMLDELGADYKDAVVFGDALNDMSMFVDDWTKVAMGNADPALKARADLVTTNVEDNGIYNACVRLGLFE